MNKNLLVALALIVASRLLNKLKNPKRMKKARRSNASILVALAALSPASVQQFVRPVFIDQILLNPIQIRMLTFLHAIAMVARPTRLP
jgi:peptidoglycan/LPS O-acetylase OafA/YrhL